LQAVRKLARSQELHSAGFLQTRLIRERNRVCEALIEAIDWADGALS
jgi:hypothetical protein